MTQILEIGIKFGKLVCFLCFHIIRSRGVVVKVRRQRILQDGMNALGKHVTSCASFYLIQCR